jgi:hypothetical protein
MPVPLCWKRREREAIPEDVPQTEIDGKEHLHEFAHASGLHVAPASRVPTTTVEAWEDPWRGQ